MFVSGSQSYKKVIQLSLRVKKLTGERMFWGKFQKRKGFGFRSRQSSKKSHIFKFSGNSSRFGTESISFHQTYKSQQPSRLGTSPSSSAFKSRMMSEKCPYCHQFHPRICGASQGVCFRCGQSRHIKKNCPMLKSASSVGQPFEQPRALIHGYGRSAIRPLGSVRFVASVEARLIPHLF